MNIRNPLITYLSWFESLDVVWADSIASHFFSSFNDLKRTYTLLETTKEEYEEMLKEEYKAMEIQESLAEEEEEEEEWIDGEQSAQLQDYLGKFIQFDDCNLVLPIAHYLFLTTEVKLSDFKSVFNCDDFYRSRHIKSLLLGDEEKAREYEEELAELYRSEITRKEARESWAELKKERYNLHTIHDYFVGDIMGN